MCGLFILFGFVWTYFGLLAIFHQPSCLEADPGCFCFSRKLHVFLLDLWTYAYRHTKLKFNPPLGGWAPSGCKW